MSDVMLFGVLGMPYDMAMEDELSRRQFYSMAQQAQRELAAYKQALSEFWPDGYLSDRAKVHPSLFPLRVSELLAANAQGERRTE